MLGLSFVDSVWIGGKKWLSFVWFDVSFGNLWCSVCVCVCVCVCQIWLVGVLVLVVFCCFWLDLVKDIVGVGVSLGCLL